MKEDFRFICCTFMEEKSFKVDYELLSDTLTVSVAMVLPYLHHEQEQIVKKDLLKIQELSYHANGSVRGKLALTNEDIEWLSKRYDFYSDKVGDKMKQFVIPQGCIAAVHLHRVRNEAKIVYRALYQVHKENPVDDILFKFTAIVSNIAGAMALYVNKINNIEEIPFNTKS